MSGELTPEEARRLTDEIEPVIGSGLAAAMKYFDQLSTLGPREFAAEARAAGVTPKRLAEMVDVFAQAMGMRGEQ